MRLAVRFAVTVSAALLAGAVSGLPTEAQSRPGQYGGGFIEYLMTGAGDGSGARAMPSAPPRSRPAYGYGYGDPYGGAPEAGAPRMRLAALPARPGPDETMIGRGLDPRYERQVVEFPGGRRPGTIVIDTAAKHLYLVQPGGWAIRYGIGVGRPGFLWTGVKTISQKREWPDWTPPPEMLQRRPDLPRHMEGGPENPLGARAMYLGSSLYRIHGTNEPHTIGQNVSSGCIRMMNEDVIDLYERTTVGARVEVI